MMLPSNIIPAMATMAVIFKKNPIANSHAPVGNKIRDIHPNLFERNLLVVITGMNWCNAPSNAVERKANIIR
jgi:hypothetical protein